MTWLIGGTPAGMRSRYVVRLSSPFSPNDTAPFLLDFSGPLSSIDCDTISSVTNIVIERNDGGTVDLEVALAATLSTDLLRVTIWLTGGTAGFEYLISVTVASTLGQDITRSFILPVNLR